MRLIIALCLSVPIAIALIACAFHRKTLFGDRVDELGADDPQALGVGGGEILNHPQLATSEKDAKHA